MITALLLITYNVQGGIFKETPATLLHDASTSIGIPYDLPSGGVGKTFLCYEPAMPGRGHQKELLNLRAWALQERLLSRRVLIFRHDQISWDCCSSSINSAGPLNYFDGFSSDSPGRLKEYTSRCRKSYWNMLIECYSRRRHSRPSDKLKALSGLANLVWEQSMSK